MGLANRGSGTSCMFPSMALRVAYLLNLSNNLKGAEAIRNEAACLAESLKYPFPLCPLMRLGKVEGLHWLDVKRSTECVRRSDNSSSALFNVAHFTAHHLLSLFLSSRLQHRPKSQHFSHHVLLFSISV